ncbi:MAG: hypothetical protein JST00_47355 [Deltaproteobacteria bacterium]|nr:hypothetical protein [Deltaproteobacteria bacterium]
MKRRARVLAVVALLFGPAACGRSCGCVEGEKTYESIDGKVKVELVRKTHWSGGKSPGPISEFCLRVHTTPVIDHVIDCDHVDMAEDDEGKTVAWRCKGKSPWGVLRLRGGKRYIDECTAPSVGVEKKPAFEKLERLSTAADRIVTCAVPYGQSEYDLARWDELFRSIEELEGVDVAAQTLVRLAARPIETGDDSWNVTYLSRSAEVRARVQKAICTALERPDADMTMYARAARFCSLDGPGVGPAAVAQLERLLRLPVVIPRPFEGNETDAGAAAARLAVSQREALEWAAVIAVKKAPAAAGAAACATAPGTAEGSDEYGSGVVPRRVAAAVIAVTKTKCDAARPWLEPPPCGEDLDCDGGLCTPKQIGDRLDAWAAQGAWELDGGARPSPSLLPHQRPTLLGYAYSQGPLDREIALRNARRHYAQSDAGGIPRCDDRDAGNGSPCFCEEYSLPFQICSMPTSETHGEYGPCAFRLDDAKKRLVDVKRVCSGENGSCMLGKVCCSPFECRYDETSKDSRCKALPKDNGAADAR